MIFVNEILQNNKMIFMNDFLLNMIDTNSNIL